jgi:hypothetical protein
MYLSMSLPDLKRSLSQAAWVIHFAVTKKYQTWVENTLKTMPCCKVFEIYFI